MDTHPAGTLGPRDVSLDSTSPTPAGLPCSGRFPLARLYIAYNTSAEARRPWHPGTARHPRLTDRKHHVFGCDAWAPTDIRHEVGRASVGLIAVPAAEGHVMKRNLQPDRRHSNQKSADVNPPAGPERQGPR